MMMRRMVFAILGLVCACGSTEPSSIAGAYNLKTVNGQALPYTQQLVGATYTTQSGTLVLTDGGTFTQTFVAAVSGSPTSSTSSGTYLKGSGTLTMRYTGSGDMSATISNGVIVLQHPNIGTMQFSNH